MKTKLALLLALALLTRVRAETNSSETVAATAEPAIERASLLASETTLVAAVKPLEAALAADPKNPALLYERAYAHYAALSVLHAKKDRDALISELEKAAALLERVQGQPWEAEAAALHGGILGQLIALKGGLSGMTLGPKSNKFIARAGKILPGNPRVLFFNGLSLLNTPTAFGGDAAAGLKLLQQSVDAFSTVDAAARGPHWGRAEALTWLGIAQQKAGDPKAARAAWEQALAIEPDYGWVKFALLPSLAQHSTN